MTTRGAAPTLAGTTLASGDEYMPTSRKLQQVYFYPPNFNFLKLRIRPLAMLAILDGVQRKQEPGCRTVGVLLGALVEGRIVDVVDAYTLPLPEAEANRIAANAEKGATGEKQPMRDITFNQEFHSQMLSLKKRAAPKGSEAVVGWWATGEHPGRDVNTAHAFFGTKTSGFAMHPPLTSPILLMVDTAANSGHLAIRAFFGNNENLRQSRAMPAVPGATLVSTLASGDAASSIPKVARTNGVVWHEIPSTVEAVGSEAHAMRILSHCERVRQNTASRGASPYASIPIQDNHLGFACALKRLQQLVRTAIQYTEDIISGKCQPDAEVGRELWAITHSMPLVPGEEFANLCHDAMQDFLMATYLGSLTRMQTAMSLRIAAQQQQQQEANKGER